MSIPQGQVTVPGCSEPGSSVTCELTERSGLLRVIPAPGSLGDITIVITNSGGLESTFTVEAPRLAPEEPVGSGGFTVAYDARHSGSSPLSVSIAPGQVLASACSSLPAPSVSCQIPGGSGTFQVIPLAPVSSVVTITLTNGLGLTTSLRVTAPPATGPTLTGPARVIPVLPFTVGYDTGDAVGGSIDVSIDAPTAGTELVWVPRCSPLPARFGDVSAVAEVRGG